MESMTKSEVISEGAVRKRVSGTSKKLKDALVHQVIQETEFPTGRATNATSIWFLLVQCWSLLWTAMTIILWKRLSLDENLYQGCVESMLTDF